MTRLLEAEGLALPGRLQSTSLSVEAGQLVCLVGPNGSGKTSLLHAIAGIGSPSGRVRISGADPRGTPPRTRIALLTFLPATRELHWPLVARDLIRLGGGEAGRIAEEMALLELDGVADRRVDRLSTGERSRVLIARALAPRPKLLLLDEPTANLDPLWQIRLMELLQARVAEQGSAALVAMHDLDAAARYGDRLILMAEGRIVADGRPAEMIDGPEVSRVFGIVREGGRWRAAVSPTEGRRSSR